MLDYQQKFEANKIRPVSQACLTLHKGLLRSEILPFVTFWVG